MRITRRQIRQIIREQLDWSNRSGGYDGPAHATDADKKPIDEITRGKIHDEIIAFLSQSQSAPGRGGMDLVDAVMKKRLPNVDSNDIFAFLDELQEDGDVLFNVEEDLWSLA